MQPRHCTNLTIQDVGDELLALNRATNELHHLNAMAAWIYRRCDGHATIESIVEGVVANFDVERAQADRDVRLLLDEFRQKGLITVDSCADDGPMAQQLLPVT